MLIVGDDHDFLQALTELLEQSGYFVDGLQDGSAVMDAVANQRYHLAIIDLMLPGTDGLTLVRNLRDGLCYLPILMVTACAGLDNHIAGLGAGADDYLVKPFQMPELELVSEPSRADPVVTSNTHSTSKPIKWRRAKHAFQPRG